MQQCSSCLNPPEDGSCDCCLAPSSSIYLSCSLLCKDVRKYIWFDAICAWPVCQVGNGGHKWVGCYRDNQIPRSAESVCSVSGIMLFPAQKMIFSLSEKQSRDQSALTLPYQTLLFRIRTGVNVFKYISLLMPKGLEKAPAQWSQYGHL